MGFIRFISISIARIFEVMIIGIVLAGCNSTSELLRETTITGSNNIDYSIIYYIHADSDYLYHDSNGDPIVGNSRVLNTAHEVAKEAKTGEVYIFYQRPVMKLLGLFPRKSSQLYQYINGQLTGVVLYRHSNKSEDFLTTESLLFEQYRNQFISDDQRIHFLYFGHEIPMGDGRKYHRTLPDIEVNIASFTTGIKNFLVGDEHKFDLIVLSTCNNGSPYMAEQLMPITNTVIASPQNLHLSHIDTGSLIDLEKNSEISSLQIAHSMAEKTYNRLESEILTAVTLAVYDYDVIRGYREGLQSFRSSFENLDYAPFYADNIDCKEVKIFDSELFSKGVDTWFKSARFGRSTLVDFHSGWGCRPIIQNRRSE